MQQKSPIPFGHLSLETCPQPNVRYCYEEGCVKAASSLQPLSRPQKSQAKDSSYTFLLHLSTLQHTQQRPPLRQPSPRLQ
jgi:hypothetical protein